MRKKIKIIQIPASQTKNQQEDLINAQLSKGWHFVQFYTYDAKFWVIFEKTIAS